MRGGSGPGIARALLLAGLLIAVGPPVRAAAQEPWDWQARVFYDFEGFSSERDNWHTYGLGIQRRFSLGSVELDVLRTHRFGEIDEAVALDAVLQLWRRAYGNVRFQAAIDPDVLPSTDAMIELYQGFGPGWEASVGYRNLDVPADLVHVVTGGIAKYIGDDWYLRQRTVVTVTGGDTNVFFGGTVRRYLKVPDDFVQLDVGAGREVIDVAVGPRVVSRSVVLVGLRAQKFFVPRFGLAVGGTFRDERDGGPVNLGATVELLTRW